MFGVKRLHKAVPPTDSTDGLLVNKWRVDSSVDGHLAKIIKGSFFVVSDKDDKCEAWKGVLVID